MNEILGKILIVVVVFGPMLFDLYYVKRAVKLMNDGKEERDKHFDKVNVRIFYIISFIPLANIFFAIMILSELRLGEVGWVIELRKEKERKKNPAFNSLEAIKEAALKFEMMENKIKRKDFDSSYQEKYFLLEWVCEYAQENIYQPEIKEILKKNELPFSYISAVLEEHKNLIDDYQDIVFLPISKKVEDFISQITEIRAENENRRKEQKKQNEKIKMTKKEEEREITEVTKKRLAEEMKIVFETEEMIEKK